MFYEKNKRKKAEEKISMDISISTSISVIFNGNYGNCNGIRMSTYSDLVEIRKKILKNKK